MIGFTGQRGVQLFYMISAFTLYLSLDGRRTEQHPWTNYFLRRFFRIAPLFYLVIVANVLLRYIAPAFSAFGTNGYGNVALSFLFLNGTGRLQFKMWSREDGRLRLRLRSISFFRCSIPISGPSREL